MEQSFGWQPMLVVFREQQDRSLRIRVSRHNQIQPKACNRLRRLLVCKKSSPLGVERVRTCPHYKFGYNEFERYTNMSSSWETNSSRITRRGFLLGAGT